MATGYRHLDLDERIEIEKLLDRPGATIRGIARTLGRSPSTISREITRGGWRPSNENASYTPYRDAALRGEEATPVQYRAGRAQKRANRRAANSHRPHRLATDAAVTYVVHNLRRGWTPEMIAGRVRLDHPGDRSMWMCPETIYQFIYAPQNRHYGLAQYLPRGHKKRRKHKGRRVHSSRIPLRVSIHHRGQDVDDRSVFGHYEGDSIEGRKCVGDGIHTEVERRTRMVFATKVTALTSTEGIGAQLRIFSALPSQARKSTTMDNGTEMHHHHRLVSELGMDTYFADPYSSWQRGTNEHMNGRIRRYLPKNTDFSNLTEEELQEIVSEINNQPRKCLGWRTAQEAFTTELHSLVTDQRCTSE